jgi:hypothetical protein
VNALACILRSKSLNGELAGKDLRIPRAGLYNDGLNVSQGFQQETGSMVRTFSRRLFNSASDSDRRLISEEGAPIGL